METLRRHARDAGYHRDEGPQLAQPTRQVWTLAAICLLAIPTGIWLGWRLNGILDQRQVYRACYLLLVVTALKLLWDGVGGYLA